MVQLKESKMENQFQIFGTGKDIFKSWFAVKSVLKSTCYAGGTNPHFQSDYIQLDSLVKKIDPVCQEHGLGIMMFPTGSGLITILFHKETGQYIQSNYELILDKPNPQGVGSALTYAKRQILQALFGLSAGEDEDDDGNLASNDISDEDNQFEKENPMKEKITSKNAYRIAKVALQNIGSLDVLKEYWESESETFTNNKKVVELFRAKKSELKMQE
jgi:hypothetical protein